MDSPPKVLLKFLGVTVGKKGSVSTDMAILGGSIAVLLGEEGSTAGELARFAAGLESPRKGKVLVGREMSPACSREGRAAVGHVTGKLEAPPGMTARGCINLAVNAAVKDRSKALAETAEILKWLDLETCAAVPVEDLEPPELQRTSMAVAMATSPDLLVVECPVHDSLHAKLQTFARAGNAVLIRASSLGEIPFGVQRIALCDEEGIARIVRHTELLSRAMGGSEITVSFYPSLPRNQIETISGIRNLLHRDGKFRFTHSETIYAVTQLMNLARANSRALIELSTSGMPPSALIRLFDSDRQPTESAGLFEEESN